jgi:signal transduction histidine kinase
LAWALFVASVLLTIGGLGGQVPGALHQGHGIGWIMARIAGSPIVPVAAFIGAGLLVSLRQQRNPAGWLMLVIGLCWSLVMLPEGVFETTYFSAMAWVLPFGLMGTHLLLRLPDGRLASPRWRWVSRASTAAIAVAGTFLPTSDDTPVDLASILGLIGLFALLFCILLSVASLVVRARRAGADERHQLRWIAAGAAVFFGVYLLSFVPGMLGVGDVGDLGGVVFVAYGAIPIGIGIAILKYRLYDIDIVIRKALIVAGLAVFFTAIYAAVVGGIGALVGSHSTTGLSFLAAALVAVGFQPALARARRFADRVVYGKRATPYEVLAEFSERVGEAYADDDVLVRMATVVGHGVGALRADVWLRLEDRMHVVASWPDADRTGPDAAPPSVTADATGIAAIGSNGTVFPIEDRGDVLGALAVSMPPSDPMDPSKESLLSGLASQARLVLRNVRLTEELKARLEDLRASRTRLVAAQDEERRRLERNIHDGAQQQLVALTLKARLAKDATRSDPGRATELLTQIEADSRVALDDLRDLARGIYPPLLADRGLVAALQAQAAKSAVAVTVSADGVGRFQQDVEAAVYFSCLEALQNAAKYAEATSAQVRLARSNGRLTFEVADDGRGFDPRTTRRGSGLQGIHDRLGALGGEIEVRSSPGAGTTVAGWIPAVAGV